MTSLQLRLVQAKTEAAERQLRAAGLRPQPPPTQTSLAASAARAGSSLDAALSEIKSCLLESTAEAQYLEQQARALLAGARGEQLAAQRALLLQVRRAQALEAMRLRDMQVGGGGIRRWGTEGHAPRGMQVGD